MTEAERRADLRRILVVLDGDDSARAALDAAARLAAARNAELVGLFVEDTELLEAAALPFTWSIHSHAGGQAPLDAAMMQRALRIYALRASAAVAAAAERLHVTWSFRVIRGTIAEQVLAAAQGCDLLALGSAGSLMRRARAEVARGLMAMSAPCSLLLMYAGARADQPVTVLYDGPERALELGRQLAEAYGRRLLVVAVGESEAAAAERQAQAAAWLERRGVRAEPRALAVREGPEVCEVLRHEYPGVLVLDRRGGLAGRIPLEVLVRRMACSVFVLR
ncbi:MAG: universal stress protein [Kiloniellaceae bacterium]